MPSGDIKDLLTRYGRGANAAELARASGDTVSSQSFYTWLAGTAKYLELPKDRIIMGVTDALGLRYDDEVLRGFALSGGRLRLRPRGSELAAAIESIRGVEMLDGHPDLVDDIRRLVEGFISTMTKLQSQSKE